MVIPHGLYPTENNNSDGAPSGVSEGEVSLLCFGKLRPYKKVPDLVRAFEDLKEPHLRLRVTGSCVDESLNRYLMEKAESLDGLQYEEGSLNETEIAEVFREASAVIIPYAETLNSGVAYLALSHGKPIIAPATPVFKEIQDAFGEEQVRLYSPPLTSSALASCIDEPFREGAISGDILRRHSWFEIAESHIAFFDRVLGKL